MTDMRQLFLDHYVNHVPAAFDEAEAFERPVALQGTSAVQPSAAETLKADRRTPTVGAGDEAIQ
jgi:hypothetical protein